MKILLKLAGIISSTCLALFPCYPLVDSLLFFGELPIPEETEKQ